MSQRRLLLLTSIVCIISTKLYSQKQTSVSIILPKELMGKKCEVTYNNGRTEKRTEYTMNVKTIHISDYYYSKYATISIHFETDSSDIPNDNIYFVSDQPAVIDFNTKTANPQDINEMGGISSNFLLQMK